MTTVTPLRLKVKDAATMLGLELQYVYKLTRDGVFTPLRPNGKGRGKRYYLLPGEVEAYARGGVAAVKAWRRKQLGGK